MLIREPKTDIARAKEVKVKIPVSHHIKLHSMKVLTGKQISDAITEALDAYFAARANDPSLDLRLPQAAAVVDRLSDGQ